MSCLLGLGGSSVEIAWTNKAGKMDQYWTRYLVMVGRRHLRNEVNFCDENEVMTEVAPNRPLLKHFEIQDPVSRGIQNTPGICNTPIGTENNLSVGIFSRKMGL